MCVGGGGDGGARGWLGEVAINGRWGRGLRVGKESDFMNSEFFLTSEIR